MMPFPDNNDENQYDRISGGCNSIVPSTIPTNNLPFKTNSFSSSSSSQIT